MTRRVLCVVHPVAPTAEEVAAVKQMHGQSPLAPTSELRYRQAMESNIQSALRWLAWLRKSFPEITFIAPWIADILAGADDSDPAARERGLVDCCAVVERCDGIVLVGGRVSTGMARERDHGVEHIASVFRYVPSLAKDLRMNFDVYDLTCPANPDPPLTVGALHQTLEELAATARSLWRR